MNFRRLLKTKKKALAEQTDVVSQLASKVSSGASSDVYKLHNGDIAKFYTAENISLSNRWMKTEAHYLKELQKLHKRFSTPNFLSENWQAIKVSFESGNGGIEPVYRGSIVMSDVKKESNFTLQEQKNSDMRKLSLDQLLMELEERAILLAELHQLRPRALHRNRTVLETLLHEAKTHDPLLKANKPFYKAVGARLSKMEKSSPKVFCHADLDNDGNIFYNEFLEVTDIVDFADSGYGMPETDCECSFSKDAYTDLTSYEFDEDKALMANTIHGLRGILLSRFKNIAAPRAVQLISNQEIEDNCHQAVEDLSLPVKFKFAR